MPQIKLLIDQYQNIFKNIGAPDWSVRSKQDGHPINPSVPFIGRDYSSSRLKIAIYASAENLTNYEEGTGPDVQPELLETESSWNRHRVAYEKIPAKYFPYVHIQPVSDGGLLCAASFIRFKLLNEPFCGAPADLLEEIAVANFGKYSIATNGDNANKDYAGNIKKLRASLPYFIADIEALKPDVLSLPNTIYRHSEIREFFDSYKKMTVVPVYQCNARNVNIHLKKYNDRAKVLSEDLKKANTLLVEWTNNIERIPRESFYRYYVHIEEVIRMTSL